MPAPLKQTLPVNYLHHGALVGTFHLIDEYGRRLTEPIPAHVRPSYDGTRWDVLDVRWNGWLPGTSGVVTVRRGGRGGGSSGAAI